MAKAPAKPKPPVVDDGWRIPDPLWTRIAELLPPRPVHPLGCHNPRVDDRKAMDAIFFLLRTGCQWGALDATAICSHSSAHRRFQEWAEAGVFSRLWQLGLTEYDGLKGIQWRWQAMDGAMTKAPLGGEKDGQEPHRPGQAGGQAERPDRRGRGADRGGGRRGQPQRPQADAGDHREHPGHAA
jgi:putative transposase